MSSEKLQVAFVASKKVGNAVKRNSSRRRTKALFSSYEKRLKKGKYIIVIKDKVHKRNFLELKKDFDFAFKNLKVLNEKNI